MRGRLIFPFLAELRRLDTAAMAAGDPDGPGPLVSGFDLDFKEPALVDRDGDGVAERERVELPPIRVPCQVEPKVFEDLRLLASGDSPRSDLSLVFHFRDLERLGLVDAASGDALIRPNDRLAGLYDLGGLLVQAIRTPPGLFVTQAQPRGFGLGRGRPHRNLLLVTFEARQLAPTRVE